MPDDIDWRIGCFLDRVNWTGGRTASAIAEGVDEPHSAIIASLDRLARIGSVRRLGDDAWIATAIRPSGKAVTMCAEDTGQLIVLVDDDVVALETYTQFLKLEGFRTATAADVAAAVQLLDSLQPDAILIDLKLPEVEDGLGLLRRVRAGGRMTPAAIMTGHYGMDDETAAEIGRLNASIAYKPLWFENMLTLVHDLLSNAPNG